MMVSERYSIHLVEHLMRAGNVHLTGVSRRYQYGYAVHLFTYIQIHKV